MISQLIGEIVQKGEDFIVIDVSGVGYHVNVPQFTLNELGENKRVKLHTYLHVREDVLALYGFINRGQLEMFKLLIGVTRIGPQTALNILSQIRIEELAAAIIHEDEKVLTRISGVGAKNAKRLILELNDRMKKKMQGLALASSGSMTGAGNMNYDAASALVSLGFGQREAQEAVDSVFSQMKEPTVEELIKAALYKLKQR